jgi:hypothetical protein
MRSKPASLKAPDVERRACVRLPVQFPAAVEAIDGSILPHPAHGAVKDISCGGFAIIMDHCVRNGARMRLSFTLPGEVRPTTVEVEIVDLTRWVTREFVAHCRFVSLPADTLRKVEDFTQLTDSANDGTL